MSLPSTFELIRFAIGVLGLSESEHLTPAQRRHVQRAAQSFDGPRPSPESLSKSVRAFADALADKLSAGDERTAGAIRDLAVRLLGLYGRVRFFLDLRQRDPLQAQSTMLGRFAAPALAVEMGEQVEDYLAGVDGTLLIPSVFLIAGQEERPTVRVLRGLMARCEARTTPAFAKEIGWPKTNRSLYEWMKPDGPTISDKQIAELCRCLEDTEALRNRFPWRETAKGKKQEWKSMPPFSLEKGASLEAQALEAGRYALRHNHPKKEIIAKRLNASVDSLEKAARGEGTWEYHLRIVAAVDALYRPWTVEQARSELLAARALEETGKAIEAWADQADDDSSIWRSFVLHNALVNVLYLAAEMQRYARWEIQKERQVTLAEAQPYMTWLDVLIVVLASRPKSAFHRSTYSLLRPMYLPMDDELVSSLTSGESIGHGFDFQKWSGELQCAVFLVDPSRPKQLGDFLVGKQALSGPQPAQDPAAAWLLARARHLVQAGDLLGALEPYAEAVAEGPRTPGLSALALPEALAVAAHAGRMDRAKEIFHAAFRRDLLPSWEETALRLLPENDVVPFHYLFPFPFPYSAPN